MHLAQLGARHAFLQAREHPAGADRRQLAGVADEHERAAALVDRGRQAGEAVGVTHAGLVEIDSRVRIQRRPLVLDRVEVAVHRVHAAGERRRVLAELLGGATGDGDADDLAAACELGAGGGIEHDALAGPRLAAECDDAIGPGEQPDRVVLLGCQRLAEALLDDGDGTVPCIARHVTAVVTADARDAGLEAALQRTHAGGRQAPIGELEHAAVVAERCEARERGRRVEPCAGRLLERDAAQLAFLEDRTRAGRRGLDMVGPDVAVGLRGRRGPQPCERGAVEAMARRLASPAEIKAELREREARIRQLLEEVLV